MATFAAWTTKVALPLALLFRGQRGTAGGFSNVRLVGCWMSWLINFRNGLIYNFPMKLVDLNLALLGCCSCCSCRSKWKHIVDWKLWNPPKLERPNLPGICRNPAAIGWCLWNYGPPLRNGWRRKPLALVSQTTARPLPTWPCEGSWWLEGFCKELWRSKLEGDLAKLVVASRGELLENESTWRDFWGLPTVGDFFFQIPLM